MLANVINSDHFNYSGGTYTGTLTNNSTGVVTLSGGDRLIDGSMLNKGTFRLSGADATIEGSYSSIVSSKLSLTLAAAGHDRLRVLGAASFSGLLELSKPADFSPQAYDPMEIVSFNSSSGRFAAVIGLELDSGFRLALSYLPNSISLTPALIGDINLDRSVTIADFINLASNFGQSGASWSDGDLNGDGSVTIADFIDLAGHFNTTFSGETVPTNAADAQLLTNFATSIPEPGLSLLFIGGATIFGRRRRAPQS